MNNGDRKYMVRCYCDKCKSEIKTSSDGAGPVFIFPYTCGCGEVTKHPPVFVLTTNGDENKKVPNRKGWIDRLLGRS